MRKKSNIYKKIMEKLSIRKKKRGSKVMYKFIGRNRKKQLEKSKSSDGQSSLKI